jgi:hypothetical protein
MKTKSSKNYKLKSCLIYGIGLLIVPILLMCTPAEQNGAYYVDGSVTTSGNGSRKSPFRSIQEGVDAALPGETVWVLPGEYDEEVSTRRDGLPEQPIIIRSYVSAEAPEGSSPGWVPEDEPERVWIRRKGRGIDIQHSHIVVDGINVDGLWHSNSYIDENGIFRDSTVSGTFPSGTGGIVRIINGTESIVLRNIEVKNNQLHLVRIHGNNILVDNARIHSAISRTVNTPAPPPGIISGDDYFRDSHGIESSSANGLTIINSYIGNISGDCVQSGRSVWSDLTIENCHFEIKPLAEPILGLQAGTWFAEDLYDTKTPDKGQDGAKFNRGVIFRNNILHGTSYSRYQHGAVLNLKEGVEGILVEGNRVFDNRMTFRLRQPTREYVLRNNYIYNNETAVWFAGPVDNVQIVNNTFYGNKVAILESGSGATGSVISTNIFAGGPHEMVLHPPHIQWNNNLFYEVTSAHGENFIEENPLFSNPDNFDFILLPESPALIRGIGVRQ